jgi:peptide/nickel transport system substrate-binding protein
MTQSFDRRSFMAGGLALGAGAAILGGLEGEAGASQTNGPGLNGVSTARPVKGGSLTFGIDTEESGFDPSTARWDEGGFLYGRSVMDPLAIVNASGGVEPYLAQSITNNEDFTSFTINLRPGIVFHDGTPLDANALHLNIEKQSTSVLTGPAFADQIASASVTGPLAVTIAMKTSWAPFPFYLAQAQTGYIAAPAMLNSSTGTSHPIGTGPFVFQDWIPNSHMTATRNPHYWRKGLPYLSSITFKPIIDPNARADALETGEVDIMHTNSPSSLLQFRGDKKWAYYDNSGQVVGQPTVQCIMLNTATAPFNNKTLRTAMAMCINQAQFSKVINKGIDAPMSGLFIPGSEYYSTTTYPKYNPTQAAKLVT